MELLYWLIKDTKRSKIYNTYHNGLEGQ